MNTSNASGCSAQPAPIVRPMAAERVQPPQAQAGGGLAVRVLTVAVGLPLLLVALYVGGWLLFTVVGLLTGVGWWEYWRMWQRQGVRVAWLPGAAGVLALLLWAQFQGNADGLAAVVTGLVLALAVVPVLMRSAFNPADAGISLAGIFYVGWLFSHVLLLRNVSAPSWWHGSPLGAGPWPVGFCLLLFALLCTWATDIGAYFIGSLVGGRRLAPALSPGKTVAGAIGGAAAAVTVAALLAPWFGLGLVLGGALGLVLSVADQIGDLAESALKRHVGIKDSGGLLPGHGGVLDRFDSTLFTVPVLYYLVSLWLT